MATVEIQGLTKWYDRKRAVEDLSLEIKDKEFLAVFGPAGAGKTTVLNLIAGIVTPNRGSVKIEGRNVDGLEPADRNLAMVFESYALYPQLNVFDNMAFPLRSPKFRMPEEKVRERVTHHAKVVRIGHLLQRPIQALSSGQRLRAALGRALVRQPDLFLLDEPLSHLDAKLRHSMRAELKEMRMHLGTTIYATHNCLEAMSLGDRVAVLSEGRLLQLSTPDDVYLRPASTDVAKLFGDPEINLLDATLKSSGSSQLRLEMLGENIPLPLPADVAQILTEMHARRIRVGVRPADVRIVPVGDKQAFHAIIYSFEPLGTKSVLTLKTVDGSLMRALVDGHLTFETNRRTQFRIDPHLLVFFDAESQMFLARSEEGNDEIFNG